jgi:hypothetical protein
MAKIVGRAIGYRIVKRGKLEKVKVLIVNADGLSYENVVEMDDLSSYPFGSRGYVGDYSVQQSLALDDGDGGAEPEKASRRRAPSASH